MSQLRHLLMSMTCALVVAACATTPVFLEPDPVPEPVAPSRPLDGESAQARRDADAVPGSLRRCRTVAGRPKVVAIGSSTMASVLGPMIERMLKGKDVDFALWGVASTSIARPDFFDWPSKIPGILKRHKPDFWVISLGTNDNQPIKLRRGGWVRTDDPRWSTVFGERIDELLQLTVGADRSRPVIWVGPYAFPGEGSRVLGRRIHELLAKHLESFPGPAFYVDAYTATLDGDDRPIKELRLDGKKPVPARGHDGIHLKAIAVKELLANPAVRRLEECLGRPIR